ncbi:MAG: glycosyltransferase, partial [Bacteroidales bacterium]|nr:glycosyltransferase [Bacteroidales bacterium]
MLLSLIIPVYNRPEELRELLASLAEQTDRDFEVIVVEDGSSESSEAVVRVFQAESQAD